MELKMKSPNVTQDSQYSFNIKVTHGSAQFKDTKLINLKVLNCTVNNCEICQIDQTLCQTCNNGYSLSSNNSNCIIVIPETNNSTNLNQTTSQYNAQVATQTAVGASIGLGSATSILSGTSTQGAWASVNQFQLYLLVPMLNIYIHPDVLEFLSGFTFAFFSFSFFKVEEFKFIKSILSVFSDEKNNSYLESIGIRYINSFRNHTKVLLTLSIFLVIHLIIILLLYKLK